MAAVLVLYCALICNAVEIGLPWMTGLPAEDIRAMVTANGRNAVRALIPFAIWISYPKRSKRVRPPTRRRCHGITRLAHGPMFSAVIFASRRANR